MYRSLRSLAGLCVVIHCGATAATIYYPFVFKPEVTREKPIGASQKVSEIHLSQKEKLYARHLLLAYGGRGNSFVLQNSITQDITYENSFAVITGKKAVIAALNGYAILKPMQLHHSEKIIYEKGKAQQAEQRCLQVELTQQIVEPLLSYHTIVPLLLEVHMDASEQMLSIKESVQLKQGVNLPYMLKRLNGLILACLVYCFTEASHNDSSPA